MKMVLNKPAMRWGEGFPLGNGHMGAMVMGGLPVTRIDLSHNTFYSGEKSEENNQLNAADAFYKMRELAELGEYDKVHEAAEQFIGVRKNYGTNLLVGTLTVDYGLSQEEVGDFERSLDIMEGMARQSFVCGQGSVSEEVFVSHPDRMMLYHIHLIGRNKIKLSFQPTNQYGKTDYSGNAMSFVCHAYETMHCDELCGVMLAGYGEVITDGKVIASEDGLVIEDASDIRLYLTMETDFKRDVELKPVDSETILQEIKTQVSQCLNKEYSQICMNHQQDIAKYMELVDLKLEGKDALIGNIPFLFQYGRYLLLSSSREDSKLPAHLQGIWNDNVACRIGWTCDMHLDINTQMNYWPSELVNLPGVAEPLFRWIEQDLSKAGEIAAKESYGLSGWVGELVSNGWGFAAPYWASPIAPCPTGGVWILTQMWEHYLYSQEKEFLQHEAFPLIRSAAEFFNQYVFKDKETQYYTCGPSISPENSFVYKEKSYQISNGCTYEMIMIRELFEIYLTACMILKQNHGQLYLEISEKFQKLLPYRITSEGSIAEWNHDLPAADRQHRHTSHLLGLYPFAQITTEHTPDLCKAAKHTMEIKLRPVENWEDTGWARSMLLLYEARLKDGKRAYEHIKSMMENLLEPNNLVYHPPTRGAFAFDHVYELDGNTGLTTGIAEVLLQSHKGMIRILPALPEEWETGSVSGLRARGNITVDLSWKDGRLQYAKLLAKKDQTCQLSYGGKMWTVDLRKDVWYVFEV